MAAEQMTAADAQVKRKSQREELQSVEGMQQASLSHKLVTIQSDVDLPPVRCCHLSLQLHGDSSITAIDHLPACPCLQTLRQPA
jgi:hypothetical protein